MTEDELRQEFCSQIAALVAEHEAAADLLRQQLSESPQHATQTLSENHQLIAENRRLTAAYQSMRAGVLDALRDLKDVCGDR